MSTDSLPKVALEAISPDRPAPMLSVSAPMVSEFLAYLRELPRLIEEGHVGRYALIKGNEIISVWDTTTDVLQAGYERFGLEPFSVQKVDPRDPERVAAIRAAQGVACPL